MWRITERYAFFNLREGSLKRDTVPLRISSSAPANKSAKQLFRVESRVLLMSTWLLDLYSSCSTIIVKISSKTCPKLVFWAGAHAISVPRYLRTLGVSLTGSIYLLPDTSPDEGIYVVDTSELFQALQGETSERKAFKKMCNLLRLRVQKGVLHNAGNDAHVRLLLFPSSP